MKLIIAVVCAAALAVTAYMLSISWGGASWVLDTVSGAAVLALVLLRKAWPALAVALGATILAGVADQPQEPGPGAAVALAYLVARGTYPVAAAGLAVVVTSWVTAGGPSTVSIVNAALWAAGLVALLSGTSGGGAAGSPGRRAPQAGAGAGAAGDPVR